MMNPWRMWSVGVRMAHMALETLDASAQVIGRRSEILTAAARNPLAADFAELGLMVTEKVRAFSEAGRSAAGDWNELHCHWLQRLGTRPSVHWNPLAGMVEAARAATRSAELVEHASGSLLRAMAPFHSAATANARRLRRQNRS